MFAFEADVVPVLLLWQQSLLTIGDIILALLLQLTVIKCVFVFNFITMLQFDFQATETVSVVGFGSDTLADRQDKHVGTLTHIKSFSDFSCRKTRRLEEWSGLAQCGAVHCSSLWCLAFLICYWDEPILIKAKFKWQFQSELIFVYLYFVV